LLALLYLFASTPALIAAHMPAVAYLFIKVPWCWGRVALLVSGLAFIFPWKSRRTLKVFGLVYFAVLALYLVGFAYLLSSLSFAVVLICIFAGVLAGILAIRRFWVALAVSVLGLVAASAQASLLLGLIVLGIFLFFVPRRLLGCFSPVALAFLVTSSGLHVYALEFFKYRVAPTAAEGVERLQVEPGKLPPKTRIRFAEDVGEGRWILGLRSAGLTWVEFSSSAQRVEASMGGSGESSDNAAVDEEAGVVYLGDYENGCIKVASLRGLEPIRSRCFDGLHPTFLGLDKARGILYVASDFSEQFTALDADSLDVVAKFSCKGGVHHFCSFPDGRIAAVSGLGAVYLFDPRLKNPRIIAGTLGFFIFHVACDPKRDVVYVASFASGWLHGFGVDGDLIFKRWLGPAIRYMSIRNDTLAVSNYLSGRVHVFDLDRREELERLRAVSGITQLEFSGEDELLAVSGKGVYRLKF